MRKRKILSILLSVCVILAFMPQMAFADTFEFGEFKYSVTGDEESGYAVTITGYTGSPTAVTIPNEIDKKPVTAIGDYAFNGCTTLESVTIPSGVKSIGSQAFYQCTSLASITIPG
ncbi:MAG: leucine-rich repeat domain-containing protein, partial [Clostridiales bacterium]|nr:leucine-rich repeat domain-containing protein [Clostridiales bacterium]